MAFLQSLGAHSGPRKPPINPTSFSPSSADIEGILKRDKEGEKALLYEIKNNDQ